MSTLKVTNLQHPSAASANVTLDSSGNATFGGNGVFAGALTGVTDLTASGGIYLGGTGSDNLLNDYEQGTWTPTIRGAGTAGTYTYEENQGHYVKIGNQVTAWINITNVTQSSAGSSTMRLEGLPFTCNWQSGFNGVGVGVLSVDGWSGIDGDYMVPTIGDNQSYITFYYMNGTNNDLTSLSITNLTESGTADIRGFVTYYTGG